MAYECLYCDGMIICDDDPSCDEFSIEDYDVDASGGWRLVGCICVDNTDGECKIAKCRPTNCLHIGIFKAGEKMAFGAVSAEVCSLLKAG